MANLISGIAFAFNCSDCTSLPDGTGGECRERGRETGDGDRGAEKKVKSRISFAQIVFSSGNVLTLLILEQICSPTFTFNPY